MNAATPPEPGPEPAQALPEGLAKRPVDPKRKLPIPVMNMRPSDLDDWDSEKVADFTAIWAPTVIECGKKRLCGICGEPLGYWIAFLGGPKSAANRAYVDPPFHPSPCAVAALTLCPHIAIPHHKRAPDHRLAAETSVPAGFDASRTDEWVMGITRDYKMDVRPDSIVFRPAPFKRVRRFTYNDQGVLTEVTEGSA